MTRSKGATDLTQRTRRATKTAADRGGVVRYRLKQELLDAIDAKAREHSLPPRLVAEILIARALDSGTLETVLDAAKVGL